MVGGNVTPKIQWYAQALYKDGNDSPTDGRVYFQEGWLRFGFRKEVQLVFGQFKPPFGRERFTPDFLILTIDRSLVTDALTPDGPYIDSFYRDRGVQLDGELKRGVRYAAAVFDGRGANHQFHGIGPMFAGQVVDDLVREKPLYGRPLRIQIGAATALRWGRDLPFRPCCTSELATDIGHFRGADRRWGVEFSGDWGDASVRAEYIRARLDFESAKPAELTASGWYVLGAKYLAPKWQVVGKHERLDPNHHVASGKDVMQTTIGLNYYIRQNRVKLMAGYVIRQERIQPVSNNLFQFQVQYFLHWPANQRARAEQ
jgi:phosphate-selective porin